MDASGLGQFLQAVVEKARGAAAPSLLPVWKRELLSTRDPPRVTYKHPNLDYDECEERLEGKGGHANALGSLISRSFFFGSPELAAIQRSLPEGLQNCSTFEMLASFIWRSRVIAFDLEREEEVAIMIVMDIRRTVNPPLPRGYYGNALIHTCALTTTGALRANPLEYAISLVRKAKFTVCDEFVRSYTDLAVKTDKPFPAPPSFYVVSDLTKTACTGTDFGVGKPVFAIPDAIILPEGSTGGVDYYTAARQRRRGAGHGSDKHAGKSDGKNRTPNG